MDTRGYLADEVALDLRDGLITRREALRRLALMGFTAMAATGLLAGCGGDDDNDGDNNGDGASATTATSNPAPSATTPASPSESEAVTFPGSSGPLQGAWAAAGQSRGAVLLIHENRGLTDHQRALAARLAKDGFSTLAIDLLSPEGGTATLGDPANASAALARAPADRLLSDLQAGLTELGRRQPGVKVGVMGFCFGGGLTWSLLHRGEPRLAAAVPFYGPAPADADFSRSRAAVLGIYAENDDNVNASRPRATAALEAAGLVHEIRTFPGVGHAFFNDTGARYDANAAATAYQAVLEWFGRHLGRL